MLEAGPFGSHRLGGPCSAECTDARIADGGPQLFGSELLTPFSFMWDPCTPWWHLPVGLPSFQSCKTVDFCLFLLPSLNLLQQNHQLKDISCLPGSLSRAPGLRHLSLHWHFPPGIAPRPTDSATFGSVCPRPAPSAALSLPLPLLAP